MHEAKDFSLFNITDEILLKIFSFLSPAELGRCAYVSKKLNALTADVTLWRRFLIKTLGEKIPYAMLSKTISVMFLLEKTNGRDMIKKDCSRLMRLNYANFFSLA